MKSLRFIVPLLSAIACGDLCAVDVTIAGGVTPRAIIDSTATTGGDGRALRFTNSGSNLKTNWLIGAQVNVDNGLEITPSTTAGGSTHSTPAVVVRNDGKVGIGTMIPSESLDVVGNIRGGSPTATLTLGNGTSAPAIVMNGAAGSVRDLGWQTSGAFRWLLRCSGDAETGNDAGSAFQILARHDSGSATDAPLTIYRAAGGAVAIGRPVTASQTLDVTGRTSASGYRVVSGVGGGYLSTSGQAEYLLSAGADYKSWAGGVYTMTAKAPTAGGVTSLNGVTSLWSAGGLTTGADFTLPLAQLALTPAGNVGIGTNAPSEKLQVTGGGLLAERATASVPFNGENGLALKTISAATANTAHKVSPSLTLRASIWNGTVAQDRGVNLQTVGIPGVNNGYGLEFASTDAATILHIRGDNGRVGIGTRSPTEALDVTGNARISGGATINGTASIASTLGVGGTVTVSGNARKVFVDHQGSEGELVTGCYNGTNSRAGLYVGGAGEPYFGSNIANSGTGGDTYSRATIPAWRIGNGSASTTAPVQIDVAAAGTAGAAITWIKALSVDGAGNVGIGTTAPQSKLAVSGNITAGDASASPTARSMVAITRPNNIAGGGTPAQAGLFIRTHDYPMEVENFEGKSALCVDKNANVGIGTTAPQSKLAVNGTITAKEVVVTQTGWADDVFAEGYALRPLADVEASIAADGHLSGVPSAEALAERGMPVAEMAAIHMRKIEELTLYAIQQDKLIAALAAQNARLEARIDALEAAKTGVER